MLGSGDQSRTRCDSRPTGATARESAIQAQQALPWSAALCRGTHPGRANHPVEGTHAGRRGFRSRPGVRHQCGSGSSDHRGGNSEAHRAVLSRTGARKRSQNRFALGFLRTRIPFAGWKGGASPAILSKMACRISRRGGDGLSGCRSCMDQAVDNSDGFGTVLETNPRLAEPSVAVRRSASRSLGDTRGSAGRRGSRTGSRRPDHRSGFASTG